MLTDKTTNTLKDAIKKVKVWLLPNQQILLKKTHEMINLFLFQDKF